MRGSHEGVVEGTGPKYSSDRTVKKKELLATRSAGLQGIHLFSTKVCLSEAEVLSIVSDTNKRELPKPQSK